MTSSYPLFTHVLIILCQPSSTKLELIDSIPIVLIYLISPKQHYH